MCTGRATTSRRPARCRTAAARAPRAGAHGRPRTSARLVCGSLRTPNRRPPRWSARAPVRTCVQQEVGRNAGSLHPHRLRLRHRSARGRRRTRSSRSRRSRRTRIGSAIRAPGKRIREPASRLRRPAELADHGQRTARAISSSSRAATTSTRNRRAAGCDIAVGRRAAGSAPSRGRPPSSAEPAADAPADVGRVLADAAREHERVEPSGGATAIAATAPATRWAKTSSASSARGSPAAAAVARASCRSRRRAPEARLEVERVVELLGARRPSSAAGRRARPGRPSPSACSSARPRAG